ncbi:TerC family protein [Bacillaceae bacterium]
MDLQFLQGLVQVIIVDLILSGDNAVVIALAARRLPQDQRRKAVIWGSAGAVGLRLLFMFIAAELLQIPFLQFVGGVLLVWIAIKLLIQEDDKHGEIKEASSLGEAVRTIIMADVVMSLDNVLAIVGVAHGNFLLIAIGIGLSIPLIFWGSKMLMYLMERFPIIVYIGSGILAWAAGEMIVKDKIVNRFLEILPPFPHWFIPLAVTAGVIAVGYAINRRRKDGKEPQQGNEVA